MPHVVVLVLDQIEQLDPVVEAWQHVGVSSLTIHESTGPGRVAAWRDDLPLLPSLRNLFEQRELLHRTLWAVVGDDFDLDAFFDATEAVIGLLDAPNTGIMFAWPVSKVRGLKR